MSTHPGREAEVLSFPGADASLSDLVAGLRARDPDITTAFYKRYGDRINRLVWRMLGCDSEHDDVVQQVFAQILSSVHRLRNPDHLEPWLLKITVNTVFKELRKRRSRRKLLRKASNLQCAYSEISPESQHLATRVYDVLKNLRDQDRVIFTLRYIEGFSLEECAKAFGKSLATIKRHLTRAREAFVLLAKEDAVLASWIEGEGHG